MRVGAVGARARRWWQHGEKIGIADGASEQSERSLVYFTWRRHAHDERLGLRAQAGALTLRARAADTAVAAFMRWRRGLHRRCMCGCMLVPDSIVASTRAIPFWWNLIY